MHRSDVPASNTWLRTSTLAAAAAAAVASLMLVSPAPARADVGDTAAINTSGGKYGHGSSPLVLRVDGKDRSARPYLFSVKVVSGATFTNVWTYCVEATVAAVPTAGYTEARWSDFPIAKADFKENAPRVKWALEHSFPSVSLDQIEAHVPGTTGITESDAIAATQAAVWFWTDGATLPRKADGSDQLNARERALYDRLVGSANDGSSEAAPTLDLSPADSTGVDGTRVGPVKVSTTVANGVTLGANIPRAAAGVSLVDANGKPVTADTKVKDGEEVFIDVPAGVEPGTVTVTAQTGEVTVGGSGRIFVGADPKVRTQTMILAAAQKASFDDKAKLSWAAAPEVTPAEVTFADECGADNDTYTIPATEGVEYLVGEAVVKAGTYPGKGSVSITARAKDGSVLVAGAPSSWKRTFDDTPCPPTTTTTPTVPPTTDVVPTPTPTPTPPGEPPLPTTGSGGVGPLSALACGLLGLGALLFAVTRKAKRSA